LDIFHLLNVCLNGELDIKLLLIDIAIISEDNSLDILIKIFTIYQKVISTIKQLLLNLTKWNSNLIGPVEWDLCYDFLSEYGLPDMSFASFDKLTELLGTDETTYLKIS